MAPTAPEARRLRPSRPDHLPIPDPLLSTSTEDLGASQGSVTSAPPYRAQPSASNTNLNELFVNSPYSEYPPSPAYRSRVDMHDEEDRNDVHDEKRGHDDHDDPQGMSEKPKVRYMEPKTERAASPVYHNQPPAVPNHPSLPSVPPFTVPRPYASGTGSGPPSTIGTDEEDDGIEDSDYDWSGEEDLVGEETKMEEKFGVKAKKKGWSFKRIVTLLFSTLIGSTLLAAILVTPAILIHFFWYKPNPTEYRLRVKKNVQAWSFWAAANLLVSWYLAFIIDLVPGVALSLLSLIWGHVSEQAKSRVELYNSVKNTIKPAFYAASAWVSWVIIFDGIFHLHNQGDNGSEEDYTGRVYQVMAFLFFLVLVFCIQKMLSHAIAFQFHRTAFKERLDELGNALKVIEKLRDYRPKYDTTSRGWKTRSGGGWRTPLWGSTPIMEKDHYEWFGSSTTKGKHTRDNTMAGGHSKETTAVSRSWEDGAEADTEGEGSNRPSRKSTLDKERDAKGKKRASGSSWAVLSGRRQPTVDDTPENKSYTPPKLNVPSDSPERQDSPSGTSPVAHTPTGNTPILEHRYPPSIGHDYARPYSPSPARPGFGTPRPGHTEDATETLAAAARALKTAVLHDARNIKGKEQTNDILGIGWIGNSTDAKRLARAIFYKFRPPHVHRKYLLPPDFTPAFSSTRSTNPSSSEDIETPIGFDNVSPEVQAAFRVFDKDNNGDISRSEIKTTLIRVYRERRALARSMRDVNHALETLDKILGFFAAAIVFFISLQVFGVEIESSLSSIYTLAIAASFIFKNAASNAFDAIMFLFVTHPFDTGDRVFVGEENLIVKKMGLFATVFTRVDGTESYFFNSQLFNMFITNIRRSPKQFESCAIQIAWDTPLETIDALESCMNQWLSTEENRWFEPATSIMLQNIRYQKYLEITIGMPHNSNWQDWGLRVARKTAFHAAVNYYCRQLGITGHEAPLPVVWADNESGTYVPGSPPASPYLYGDSPAVSKDDISIVVEGSQDGIADDNKVGESLQPPASPLGVAPSSPTLGFKPPASAAAQLRARKSKGRKAIMRGMDA
ncbi:hypothetical protein AAF712_005072 [Marasmius tenuissimus]|uniref:EF-hand domain-containing protein n=1 Tax=Marasmius tenuissimus TaxID=585030 RepID=A0ABR3A3M0_9AGAR|nr:hypothetical protein PM082_016457 [Marasmius tenuissimus]